MSIATLIPLAAHFNHPPRVVIGGRPSPVMTNAVEDCAEAHKLLHIAYDATYRWPQGFPGFRAKVRWFLEGGSGAGGVEVTSPTEVQLQLDGQPSMCDWLREEFVSMAGHWWPASYDETYGDYAANLCHDNIGPFGRLISLNGDPFSSSFRVHEGQIAEMNHRMGSVCFSVHILERRPTPDGRTLPTRFKVTYRDVQQGRLTHVDTYTDTHTLVSGVSLLSSRSVVVASDRETCVWRLLLRHHELLPGQGGSGVRDRHDAESRPASAR